MMKSNQVNRRNFLRLSTAAGAALVVPAGVQAVTNSSSEPKFEERILGRTGIKVPILSMGVMKADNPNVVNAAYKSGIYLFDTANGYQNGKNEEMLGTFFKGKARNSFVLATKVKVKADEADAGAKFIEKFEISMKRLKLKYVEILYYHAIDNADHVNSPAIVEAMVKLKKDGRIKNIGVSTHSNEPNVINAAIDNGNYDVVLTAYNFTQAHHDELDAALERAVKAGLGTVAMKTMAGGFLDKERTKKVDVKAALKWAWKNPNIHTAIPGFVSFDELETCLEAAGNPEMTEAEKQFIAEASCQHGLYCQGCKSCIAQCPQQLPIPDMMRAYMYNYGYKSPMLAKDTILALNLSDNPCKKCTSCHVKCINGFQVAEKISDITRLQNIPNEFLV
ncbi:MAG: aldo/keto reductase [Bacteroidales bacterium]|jgi:predicted aldo/keto reductase-like oxidoreductase|nr:aldo/keto reductase [Bacteroidales bacterium]